MIYHTGYVGHLRRKPYRDLVFQKPELMISNMVSKQFPKNKLRYKRLRNLFIYRDQEHDWPSFLPKFAEREPINKDDLLAIANEKIDRFDGAKQTYIKSLPDGTQLQN